MQSKLRYIRRATLISCGLVLFLIGLALPKLGIELHAVILVSLAAALIVFGLLKHRKNRLLITSLLFCVFVLGLWRGSMVLSDLHKYNDYFGQNITVAATAREDAVYSERRQLVFSATNVQAQETGDALIGNIQVEGYGVPMVYKGDSIQVTGKLFPKRGDNQAGMSFANISVTQSGGNIVDSLRRQFAAGMQNVLPEPLASFGMGLLIGQRATLPEQLVNELTAVGLIHIVAVSGYNLTVLVNISRRGFQSRSRYQSFMVSAILIATFLLFTGGSPSIVRAAVVSIIGLIGWYYGRAIKPMIILLLSAVLTAAVNPLYLWSSIGWYLSFTAFFGVLVLAPLLRTVLLKPKLRESLLPQILTETFSAQLCTLPIILFIFGRLSIISVVANVLVIPAIPFAMLASLIAGVYGMIGPVLFGGVLVMPARMLLEYILSVSSLLSTVPYANIEVSLTSSQMGLVYFLLLLSTTMLWHKTRKNAIVI